MEVDSIPQQTQEKTAQIDSADLVVGIFADLGGAMASWRCAMDCELCPDPLESWYCKAIPARQRARGKLTNGPRRYIAHLAALVRGWSRPFGGAYAEHIGCLPISFRSVEKLGARACCFVASEMERATPQWICQLLHPLLESDCDLVVPFYAPRKLQGLLNSSIIYPLTRCLYGKRIRNPFGPDIGVSRKLAQKILGHQSECQGGRVRRTHWRRLCPWLPAITCKYARCMSERASILQRIGRT